MNFATLPASDRLCLRNVTVPGCLAGAAEDLVRADVCLEGGRIARTSAAPAVDLAGAMVFPAFVDMHTHLDKGHIWGRTPNPDGTFAGALAATASDREAHWSAGDMRARMDFALRSAFAHGTRAIRTHLDSMPPQDEITWSVFSELREEWAGRLDLQGVCLVGADQVDADGPFARVADTTARHRGVLGMVSYPVPDLPARLQAFLDHAARRGLSVDLHVDETGDPSTNTLRLIAETVLETGFDAPVVVGHCCSQAVLDPDEADATLDLVARAELHVVSLPLCNLYLQDRQAGRTPRWRGITRVHEMKARGISVSFASDNTRDPFYAYGDLDMLEVMRQATRIGHLDHSDSDWPNAFLTNPAAACGLKAPSLVPGAPADLVICKARSWTELFARPQSDRIVLRAGRPIDRTLPDYAELDHLMGT